MHRIRIAAAAALAAAAITLGGTPALAGPTGPCTDPGEFFITTVSPDGTGAIITADVRYKWDGTSVKPNCDGQVTFLETKNTGTAPAWALLPDKKKAPLYVRIDPGTDVVVTAKGTLNNLGLSNASDVRSVTIAFTDPAA